MNTFLKWPGGKRWFIAKYYTYLPTNLEKRYIEPFLGGGSVFFYLLPKNAILADINSDLINTYQVMRNHHQKLENLLLLHQERHNRDYYYFIRNNVPDGKIEQAARFLYLNRTCFNGMYRENKDGKFNVPIGIKDNCTYDLDNFSSYASVLKNAELKTADFGKTIRKAQSEDFLFIDPPYTIAHNQNSFIKYNQRLFTWSDQHRLLEELSMAKERGAIILSTNANYNELRKMYERKGFFIKTISRYCSISGLAKGRGVQEELLISSTPFNDN